MIVAVAALIVATTGSAVAARRYLITSTGQIAPRVLAQLHGRPGVQGIVGPQGERGLAGPAGATGAAGPGGAVGPAGPFPDSFPSGKTVTGAFSFRVAPGLGNGTGGETTISYPFRFGVAPHVGLVNVNQSIPVSGCPGTAANPRAAAGWVCLYLSLYEPIGTIYTSDPGVANAYDVSGTTGIVLNAQTVSQVGRVIGTWAATGT
jgi:hypothetical protein